MKLWLSFTILQFSITIALIFLGNFLFTFTHEEIHAVIFSYIGNISSTIKLGFLGQTGITIPANETIQNPKEVYTLQAITELYQYQIIVLFVMVMLVFFLFSICNFAIVEAILNEKERLK
jgi:hypothetical protein